MVFEEFKHTHTIAISCLSNYEILHSFAVFAALTWHGVSVEGDLHKMRSGLVRREAGDKVLAT